jgi:hypothetical protein
MPILFILVPFYDLLYRLRTSVGFYLLIDEENIQHAD